MVVRLENIFEINKLKHLEKKGISSELRNGFSALWEREKAKAKTPEGLPVLPHRWLISCGEDSEKWIISGLAYSKPEKREPDAYFLFEENNGKWEEIPLSAHETQMASNGLVRDLKDNNALFSRYRFSVEKKRITVGKQYRIVAYFHEAKKIYLLPATGNTKEIEKSFLRLR